jgi:hypothetical protein
MERKNHEKRKTRKDKRERKNLTKERAEKIQNHQAWQEQNRQRVSQ